jgi:hypothetical protein
MSVLTSSIGVTAVNLTAYSRIKMDTSSAFEFEKVDPLEKFRFVNEHPHYAVYASVLYLIGIVALERFMKEKEPIKLKWSFAAWNAGIGIFSIVGFARVFPSFCTEFVKPGGFYRSICVV